MKIRLLKKLRRKANKKFYIIKQAENKYMIPEYANRTYGDFNEAVLICDFLRKEHIIKSLKAIYNKKHKKLY